MKRWILLGLLMLYQSCFAEEGCARFSDQSFVMSSTGVNNFSDFDVVDWVVHGAINDAEHNSALFINKTNVFDIEFTPINYCEDGLVAQFKDHGVGRMIFFPWRKEVIVSGEISSFSYISFTLRKLKG